jgi:hypothetical protein
MADKTKVEQVQALIEEAKKLSAELSEDELQQVSGAGECMCVGGGGGKATDEGDGVCACVAAGTGMSNKDCPNLGKVRCGCFLGGGGRQYLY